MKRQRCNGGTTTAAVVAAVMMGLSLTAGAVHAQQEKGPAFNKAGKPQKEGVKEPGVDKGVVKRFEAMFGNTLTEEQKQQLLSVQQERNAVMKAAEERYRERLTQILGVSAADLEVKENAMREKERQDKMKAREGAANAEGALREKEPRQKEPREKRQDSL